MENYLNIVQLALNGDLPTRRDLHNRRDNVPLSETNFTPEQRAYKLVLDSGCFHFPCFPDD